MDLIKRLRWRKLASGCVLLCCVPAAEAQTSIMVNNPADKFNIAPGGVDLRSGRYVYDATDLAIGGDGDSGLSLKRTMPDAVMEHYNSFGNFSNNWDVMLVVYPWDVVGNGSPDGFQASVHNGGLATTFASQHNSTGYSVKSDGAVQYLTYTGSARMGATAVYTYTAGDGTVIVFRPLGGGDCANVATRMCAFASSITKPDGTKYTLNYTATGESSGNLVRLSSVVSSRGYAIVLEGATGSAGYGSRITKACVVNLSQATLPSSCPSNALQTATYAYSGLKLTGITAPDGQTSTVNYVTLAQGYQMQFVKPGQTTPWLTNTFGPSGTVNEEAVPVDIVTSQSFADGRTYTYSYTTAPNTFTIAGGGYNDNQGSSVALPYGFPAVPGKGQGDVPPCTNYPCSDEPPDGFMNYVYQQTPGPISITDQLGRTTTFDYCDPVPMQQLPSYYTNRCFVIQLQSVTDPEKGKTFYTYSGRNVIGVRKVAKPTSGLPDIVTSATYDCSVAMNCAKPTSVTDAKGNVTTYTYDTTHGGILTETDPAAPVNGTGTPVAAVKRYAYVQRYAGLSNGSGGYTPAATPVWLLATMKTCRTTATNLSTDSCAGGASDEMVTAYDYGPTSGANNLLLRGTSVTAADTDGTIRTLRTCYGYDALGNKISETKPRGTAALTVCP